MKDETIKTSKQVIPGATDSEGKALPAEMERRVKYTERIMREKYMSDFSVVKKLRAKYGIGWRQARIYIKHARQRILMSLDVTKDELRVTSIRRYEVIIHSQTATAGEKVRAQERIDKLQGLDRPIEIEHKVEQKPNALRVSELPMATRKDLLKQLRSRSVPVTPATVNN